MTRLLFLAPLALVLSAATCSQTASGPAEATASPATTDVDVTDIAGGLEHPWGIAFLPDGRMLVTERAGDLRIVTADGTVSDPVAGVPEVVAQRQGGLLDVALAPDFENSGHVYLSYSRPGPGTTSATALGRGTMQEDGLADFEVLFTQEGWHSNGFHFGGRIAFTPDGQHLFLSTGERNLKDPSQDLSDHLGTLVRLNLDGSVPQDNPFVGQEGAQPEIWSYGHRNVQSLAFHPETGDLWEAEFGPKGGDELNRITPGTNYGWPEVSWGDNYDDSPIPDPPTRPEFTDALLQWTPVISPSGMTFYTADTFSGWTGSLLMSSLSRRGLVRVEITDDTPTEAETISLDARIRDVEQGPDGHVYVLTDERDGHVWRLSPGQ